MNKSKSLIFFGTEQFSLSALESLVDNDFNVVAVVTKPDSKKGRGKELKASAVKEYALAKDIPLVQHADINDIEKELIGYDAFAAVLSSFGKIIPPSILSIFRGGIVNVHPSLLPRYRGASPIEQSVLNGDDETGVSLMRLVEKMDAGPVYAQEIIALEHIETAPELYVTLAQAGSRLLSNNLARILDGQLVAKPQDESLVSLAPMISKQDGIIDWNQSAQQIERQVRAYLDWPGSKATISDTEVTITSAKVIPGTGDVGNMTVVDDEIHVQCAKDILVVNELKPAGKREMSTKEFLAGNPLEQT